jgi:hypothetical protein
VNRAANIPDRHDGCMVPTTFTAIAWLAIAVAIATAVAIVIDIRRVGGLTMGVMEVVWPVTALYLGPLAWVAYRRWRRVPGGGDQDRSLAVAATLGASHCGAGCTLGDIVGSALVFLLGLELLGLALWAELVLDFVLAYALGIVFQYLTIAPMRNLTLLPGLRAAVVADTLSLVAFEVGLFGWMIVVQLVMFPEHVHPNEPAFWFLMQIGMALGFVTAWPVNWWLVRTGRKERM